MGNVGGCGKVSGSVLGFMNEIFKWEVLGKH